MKYFISIVMLISCFAFKPRALSLLTDCDNIPEINKQIVEQVKSKINTKVGRGECWDLAATALKAVDAKWDGMYVFGKQVNFEKECIYAGDIIQFEKVRLKYEKNNVSYIEEMKHHTAVIYEVKGKGIYILAHQNIAETGKKVGLTSIDLNDITKGKFKIYRPIN